MLSYVAVLVDRAQELQEVQVQVDVEMVSSSLEKSVM